MFLDSFFQKFSLNAIVAIVLTVVVGLLLSFGTESILEKFGVETKASLQVKLKAANDKVALLEQANKNLVAQIDSQEKRHKTELTSVTDLLNHAVAVNKTLTSVKEKLTAQNTDLKKRLQTGQDDAYSLYKVPKASYFIFAKADYNNLSENDYAALKAFYENPTNGFSEPKTDSPPIQIKPAEPTKLSLLSTSTGN